VSSDYSHLLPALRRELRPIRSGWEALLRRMADARIVCIGEASHGTEEFYRLRAQLTRTLIDQHGFIAVVAEADWPDAYRINRYVRGEPALEGQPDANTYQALDGFKRFPAWMWRNHAVRHFVESLRQRHESLQPEEVRAGFYGMDLYSLYRSIDEVIRYLRKADPALAESAIERYGCFERFETDPQHYGYRAGAAGIDSCEDAVVQQLTELQRRAGDLARRDGQILPDEYFYAEQNARLVRNAEEYNRSMYRGRANSWNLRDTHMADTVDALLDFLVDRQGQAKIVLWAHNSHLGDARATQMAELGELNVGQLLRQRHPQETFHLGFTTFHGSVLAATDWDGPPEVKRIRPGLAGSYEELFHQLALDSPDPHGFWLDFETGSRAAELLLSDGPLLERAIGVIYRPETERQSHYFHAQLAKQFDAVIHIDRTRALDPLDPLAVMPGKEVPETYPSAV
jgi:erythromycin esterase-like protein